MLWGSLYISTRIYSYVVSESNTLFRLLIWLFGKDLVTNIITVPRLYLSVCMVHLCIISLYLHRCIEKSNRRSEVNHNHRIRSYMKKKYKIFFGTLILLTIYTYFHCNTYITQRQWKQTSDNGIIGGGIISFGDDSSFSYHWPIIEKDNKNIGVVLLCVGERMVVYSLQDNSIGFYMYI